MKTKHKIDVIPAQPGWRTIYDVDDEDEQGSQLLVLGSVIAWRVETDIDEDLRRYDEAASWVYPIELSGDVGSNCWGFMRPDGIVEARFDGEIFNTLADAQRDVDREKKDAARRAKKDKAANTKAATERQRV